MDAVVVVRRFASRLLAIACLCATVACHPGPIVDTGPKPPTTGGTISGTVRDVAGAALVGRRVTVTSDAGGAPLSTTTTTNGGYTLQVPTGTYRIEVELRSGETLSKKPDPTKVDAGDLDANRDFIVSVR